MVFYNTLFQSHKSCPQCTSPKDVSTFFELVLGLLFPDFCAEHFNSQVDFENYVSQLQQQLSKILANSPNRVAIDENELATRFFEKLPRLYEFLLEDVAAMYEGDPAAKSREEVIRTYPGFYAIAAYRIANALHADGIEGIPRIITEYAHSKTGIDIHPSATIGRHFCIDHGTGLVIGETAVIGHHVKLYQGVTLGALSVDKKDANLKRHPTLGDRVIVYAGATILGGQTVIGSDSIIGGNAWITSSIPEHSKIYYQSKRGYENLATQDSAMQKDRSH